MQIAIFTISPADKPSLDELNRFLRGRRVLTLDREFSSGVWSFCVTFQPVMGGSCPIGESAAKLDYKAVLDEKTFAVFSRLRELRKPLAEKEHLPPYAVFTNEQLAEVAKARCRTEADLTKVDGIGPARLQKYGSALLAVMDEFEKLQNQTGADRRP